jgi:hypothetical protein
MVARRALVRDSADGRIKELPAGDTLVGASGGGGGSQEVFVQQTRPVAAGPWLWWETDALGNLVDLTVNDGL